MGTEAFITLDLHGKNLHQARVSIDAALRRAQGAYALRIIHGYNHGSAISDMIRESYGTHPRVLRLQNGPRAGCTELVLRDL